MEKKQVSLVEANEWFRTQVIPKRTARGGFSGNRVWKSPLRLVTGNTEDANGLCGDATEFVVEEFYRTFGDYRTNDGHHIGMVLWRGEVLNHIAAVQLDAQKVSMATDSWDPKNRRATRLHARRGCFVLTTGRDDYSTSELQRLTVYDLYYKQDPQTLWTWWGKQDTARGGTITVGLPHDFAE